MALNVEIDFNASVAKFGSQMDRISGELGKFEQRAKSVSASVGKSFAAIGVGLSVAGVASFVKSGIDAADALSKLSTRTGIAVESLTGLKLAAELSDTNINTLGRSVNRLSINIAQNRDEFAKLGISAKDPTEAFLQFADVFSSIENAQDRAAFGAKVLGKSYADLAPLLAQGSAAIREQVKQGRELSGLTQEQADKAALFNDQLSIFKTRLAGLNTAIVYEIIDPLTRTSLLFSQNIEKTGILRGAWLGFLDTFKESVGLKTGLEGEIEVIDRKINKVRESLKDLQGGTGFGSQLIPAKEKELNDLLNQRFEIVKKISAERAGAGAGAATKANQADIQKFIEGENSKEKAAEKAAEKRLKAIKAESDKIIALYESTELSLERQIALHGKTGQAAQLEFDIQHGALEKLNDTQKVRLLNLAAEADLIEKNAQRQQAMWDQLVEDANEFVDITKAIQEFASGDVSMSGFNSLLGRIKDDLDAGIISAEQAKQKFDELGRAFNEGFVDDAKSGLDTMSTFADQAARNMQDSFADFLFDPFAEGTKGMLDGFLTSIRRMTAELASSMIFDALKPAAKAGLSAAGSGISSFFGFEDGGIMTGNGPVQLRKYSRGGVANSPQLALYGEGSMAEAFVPLPDGRSIPVKMEGGGKPVIVNNYFTIGNNVSRQSQDQIAASAGRGIQQALLRTQ